MNIMDFVDGLYARRFYTSCHFFPISLSLSCANDGEEKGREERDF
jgi:hypothetical protein